MAKEEKSVTVAKAPLYPDLNTMVATVKETAMYKEILTTLDSYNNRIDALLKESKGKITTDIQAKTLDSIFSEAKSYVSTLTKKGEEIRAPYTKTAKVIKEMFDKFAETSEANFKEARLALQNYLLEKKKQEEERERVINEQKATLAAWVKKATAEIMAATTPEECTEIGIRYIKPFNPDLFDKIDASVVTNALNTVKETGKNKRMLLMNPPDDPINEELLPEAIDSTTDILDEINSSGSTDLAPAVKLNTNLRKQLKWKVWKSIDELPAEFKTVDEKAVNKWMADHADEIKEQLEKNVKEGQIVSVVKKGVEFYFETGTTTR